MRYTARAAKWTSASSCLPARAPALSAWAAIPRSESLNAFREGTYDEVVDAIHRAGCKMDIGVIVLTGAGTRAFGVGGDSEIGIAERISRRHLRRGRGCDTPRGLEQGHRRHRAYRRGHPRFRRGRRFRDRNR